MFDLLGNLPALLGGLAALIALIWGKGKLDRRRGRKEGAQEVRRRAEAAAQDRKDKRNEIDDDIAANGADAARDSLRSDWAD